MNINPSRSRPFSQISPPLWVADPMVFTIKLHHLITKPCFFQKPCSIPNLPARCQAPSDAPNIAPSATSSAAPLQFPAQLSSMLPAQLLAALDQLVAAPWQLLSDPGSS